MRGRRAIARFMSVGLGVLVVGSLLLTPSRGVRGICLPRATPAAAAPPGIHKIKHVIMIMQENRSFDSYFGTYPGADGIPMKNGKPTVCVPSPGGGCTRPYHDRADRNGGGPHGEGNAVADVNGGQMNAFIQQRDAARASCRVANDPACAG